MSRMPGAVWRPIPVSGSRPQRRKGRGVCLHVAVSESASLYNFFSTADVDSHFYVNAAGVIEQYVDSDLVAYANLAGNASLISVETQGGVVNAESEPWTGAQVESLARIAKWAHDVEGVPLQVMRDSLPTTRGIGYHKLGVDPYRAAGGEVWSSSYGKTCPGMAKITQVAAVVRRAVELATPQPSPSPSPAGDDMKLNAYRVKGTSTVWVGGPGLWRGVPTNAVLSVLTSSGTLGPTVDVADADALAVIRDFWLSAVVSVPLHSAGDPRGDWGIVDRLPAIDAGVQALLGRVPAPPAA